MKTVPLGTVASLDRSVVDPALLAEDTPYLGLEHIARGGQILGRSTLGESAVTSAKFRFAPEHVLFGKLRPNLGKVSRPNFSGVCSTDILPIRPGPTLDRGYLAHYLSQPEMVSYAASRASGANLPRLSPTALLAFPIPLPNLPEQRRIAAILDRAEALRAKRREVLAHLDSLAQAIFHDMFGHQRYPLRELGEVSEIYGGASLPAGQPFTGQTHGTLLMRVSDMNEPANQTRMESTSLWTDQPTTRSATVDTGAVVLPKRGASIATNKKRVTTRRTALDPNLMGIQPGEDVTSEYLHHWFHSFDLQSITSGTTVPQLNKKDLAPLPIPVPPLATQRLFLDRLTTIQTALRTGHSEHDLLDELFATLQARAFRGEL